MDLALTEEQEMIKNAAREFVEQEFPKELLLLQEQLLRGFLRLAYFKMLLCPMLGS